MWWLFPWRWFDLRGSTVPTLPTFYADAWLTRQTNRTALLTRQADRTAEITRQTNRTALMSGVN